MDGSAAAAVLALRNFAFDSPLQLLCSGASNQTQHSASAACRHDMLALPPLASVIGHSVHHWQEPLRRTLTSPSLLRGAQTRNSRLPPSGPRGPRAAEPPPLSRSALQLGQSSHDAGRPAAARRAGGPEPPAVPPWPSRARCAGHGGGGGSSGARPARATRPSGGPNGPTAASAAARIRTRAAKRIPTPRRFIDARLAGPACQAAGPAESCLPGRAGPGRLGSAQSATNASAASARPRRCCSSACARTAVIDPAAAARAALRAAPSRSA
jgi:hypothetical protein